MRVVGRHRSQGQPGVQNVKREAAKYWNAMSSAARFASPETSRSISRRESSSSVSSARSNPRFLESTAIAECDTGLIAAPLLTAV